MHMKKVSNYWTEKLFEIRKILGFENEFSVVLLEIYVFMIGECDRLVLSQNKMDFLLPFFWSRWMEKNVCVC